MRSNSALTNKATAEDRDAALLGRGGARTHAAWIPRSHTQEKRREEERRQEEHTRQGPVSKLRVGYSQRRGRRKCVLGTDAPEDRKME